MKTAYPPSNQPVASAFGISNDDIILIFARNGAPIDEETAELISKKLDHDAIAIAACKASADMNKQTEAAYEEIERQINEMGEKCGW